MNAQQFRNALARQTRRLQQLREAGEINREDAAVAFERMVDRLEAGGGCGDEPRGPRAGGVVTRAAEAGDDSPAVAARKRREASRQKVMRRRQARKQKDREARANAEGEATKRGRPPKIVTAEPES